jgi:CRP-like cAMP-binding protein
MGNHAFSLIAHSEVDVSVGGTHRRTLGPNDFFGGISMMLLDPATATLVTRTPRRPSTPGRAERGDRWSVIVGSS